MNAIKIFYSYARLDKRLRDELEKHLEPLKRSGQIITWYDREIQPGNDWEHEIKNQLDTADIILLLLSPNFVSSNYCYGQEMQQALERQKRGDVCIIPIVLRPVSWQELPIGNLQALPSDGKPVSTWRHRGEAFEDIVRGISQVVSAFQRLRTSQDAEREEEKKTSSQAQQLSLFTNELLAKMNIAGRTPLMALYGYLELLARTHERLDAQGRSRILSRARDSQKEAIS